MTDQAPVASGAEHEFTREQARVILEQMAGATIGTPTEPEPSIRPWKDGPWRAELRYQALVEKIPAVTFVAALDDPVQELYVSPQIEKLLGFSQEEWLEDPFLWFNQLHPEDRDRWVTEFARTCATGANFRSEYRLLARDGRVVWVYGECHIVPDEQGHPLFLQGIAFDITASKQAEEVLRRSHDELEVRVRERTAELARANEALRESEARITSIVDAAADGILTIDERGAIEWLNPAALAIFGYTAEELIGKDVNLLMPDVHASGNDVAWEAYLSNGERRMTGDGREVSGLRKDGRTFPAELSLNEVKASERRSFTGIVRDISQRKDAERELRTAKEAAEAASHAKDHFLAVLSHELRTPLTPVLASVESLGRQKNLPEEVAASLETIRRNVAMEARIIDDLLDLTRISRGKVELRLQAFDAHACLRHALEVWQREIEAKRLEVSLHLWAEETRVWADPARLQQIFWNLIGNSAKFTPEGGRITLRSSNDAAGRITLQVSDTGIGISPEMLPRLFNAFEQGERTVTRRYGGLGLGLAISRALVEMMQGTLSAESEGAGRGSTFTLSLSTTQKLETELPGRLTGKPEPGRRTPKVLLVEDHADTLRVMARLLRSSGYTVSTAENIRDALRLADAEPFDLLISDLGLPDGSGHDLMRQVQAKQPIRGIALSGFGMDEDVQKSQEAGFTQHLTKPASLELLEAAIRQVWP